MIRLEEFNQFNDRRILAGIGVKHLLAAAKIREKSWSAFCNGRRAPRITQMRKLKRALKQLQKQDAVSQNLLYGGIYRTSVVLVAMTQKVNPQRCLLARQDNWSEWKYSANVRRMAVYYAVVFFNVPAHEMAKLLDVSRAAISKILKEVEDARDVDLVDATLTYFEAMLTGETLPADQGYFKGLINNG